MAAIFLSTFVLTTLRLVGPFAHLTIGSFSPFALAVATAMS